MKSKLTSKFFLFQGIMLLFFCSTIFITNTTLSTPSEFLSTDSEAIIANHVIINRVRLDQIPESAITAAKDSLHIAYGHTSHGSQVITGMNGLPAFKEGQGGTEGLYDWEEGGSGGALDIDDYFVDGDLGNPDRTTWAERTRTYLDDPSHSDVNVVMWSWCGQVSWASEEDINTYLSLMNGLETDYPDITFVYMTGHTDGTGLEGNLHIRNNQIRDYCLANDKVLYDFAAIESYNPDGAYFGDKYVTDNCDYDNNGDGNPYNDGANWALEWQAANPGDWYDCSSAHSQPLNANQKAYAAWWLWARLAGWDDPNPTTLPSVTTTPNSGTSSISNPLSVKSALLVASLGLVLVVLVRTSLFRKK
ncbi:MAG: hypothetical protein GF308_14410 [Candidatus Heimdallarchaeota archaeon]|nr:hypothetical protein [Candidatus Heimdallarchaeota archaeon]